MPKIKDEYDVGAAFARIENELMSSMIRNMERHKVEEINEEKEWEMWQALQLKSLDKYKRENARKYGTQFRDINKRIGNILTRMNNDGQMDQERKILKAIKNGANLTKASDTLSGRFFEINDRKMDALIEATTEEIRKAETAVLRKADDVYRKTIFNAQVYANSGAGTYEKAVDMATKDFMAAGLNCVEYKNGARHTLSDYADMAVRTAAKRAYLQGEGTKRKEWGIHTVIVNKRSDTGAGGVCPECLPFVGKVFIDDVWSGGKEGEKDENGEELPLLSDAIAAGLYHPRCRDSHTTYIPGISRPPSGKITKKDVEEAVETEKEEARQQYAERQAEKYERLADTRLDPENKRKYEARAEEWKDEADKSEELTARRKERIKDRRQSVEKPKGAIDFDSRISERQKELIQALADEYNTRLERVTVGAKKAAGDVDISGSRMRLSDKHDYTIIHEFAHTLANSSADKYGLTNDQELWKEIKSIRRKYMKEVENVPNRWISAYEHSGKSVDEFMAEAFTHAKMREMGLPIPDKYGKDFTYSQQVLDTVNKYFGKKPVVNSLGSDIINQKTIQEVAEVHLVGTINRPIFECVTKDIVTDEVIITDHQIMHIKNNHPNDYERFSHHFSEIVANPDYIIRDNKPDTAIILKEIMEDDERFYTVLRLSTSKDPEGYKNSIITFLKIDQKRWDRYLRRKEILYKRI